MGPAGFASAGHTMTRMHTMGEGTAASGRGQGQGRLGQGSAMAITAAAEGGRRIGIEQRAVGTGVMSRPMIAGGGMTAPPRRASTRTITSRVGPATETAGVCVCVCVSVCARFVQHSVVCVRALRRFKDVPRRQEVCVCVCTRFVKPSVVCARALWAGQGGSRPVSLCTRICAVLGSESHKHCLCDVLTGPKHTF